MMRQFEAITQKGISTYTSLTTEMWINTKFCKGVQTVVIGYLVFEKWKVILT